MIITIHEQGLESCYAAPTLHIEGVSDTDAFIIRVDMQCRGRCMYVSVLHRSRVHFDASCYLLVFNGGCCFILQPHQDGPSYFPVVAILSLGSPVVMDFTPHAKLKLDSQEVTDKESDGETFEIGKDKWLDDHRPFSVILMPRSLLIFKDEAYSGYFSLVL